MRICQLKPITAAANVACAARQRIGNVSASFANVVKKAFQSIANFFARIKNGTVCFLKNRVTSVKNGACFLKDKVTSLFRKKVSPQGSNGLQGSKFDESIGSQGSNGNLSTVRIHPPRRSQGSNGSQGSNAPKAPAVPNLEEQAAPRVLPEFLSRSNERTAVAPEAEATFANIVAKNNKWKKLFPERQEAIQQAFMNQFAQIKAEAIANAPNTRGVGKADQQAIRVEAQLKLAVTQLINEKVSV